MRGISAEYHPNSDGAHFAYLRLQIAFYAAVIAIGLAIVQSIAAPGVSKRVLALMLLTYLAGLAGSLVIGRASLEPQYDYRLLQVGKTAYAVPRQYSPTKSSMRGEGGGLWAEYCVTTGRAKYAGRCPHEKGFPRHSVIELSRGNITSVFSAYHGLNTAEVPYEGDMLSGWAKSPKTVPINIAAYSGFSVDYGRRIYLLSAEGQIELFAQKRINSEYATVYFRTSEGVLRYISKGPDEVDPDRWIQDAQWAADLVETWRCVETKCTGVENLRVDEQQ